MLASKRDPPSSSFNYFETGPNPLPYRYNDWNLLIIAKQAYNNFWRITRSTTI
jgi:hypothetical protein